MVVAALVVVAALAVLAIKLMSGGDDGTGAVPAPASGSGGAPVSARSIALVNDGMGLAYAEETAFGIHHRYVAAKPTNVVVLDDLNVPMSPGTVASVGVTTGGEAFCEALSGPGGTFVYISDQGGRQAPSVTACPSSYSVGR